ncbi:hypothetical protein GW933_00810 [Candidatus Falkowbacteria bacterium]|nr:hypothetical protein [Candidatus Falkowbacteria bacterium]
MRQKMYVFSIIALLFSFSLAVNIALAHDEEATSTDEIVINVNADDLGINNPKVLPDSPWYGLKKFWEGVIDTFTFNPITKAENNLTRASERLIEMQELIENGKINDADKVIAQYEKRIDSIRDRIEKLTDIHSDKAEKFLDKFAEHQIKHRLILEKIQESSAKPEEISAVKDKALSALSEALAKTDNEELQARLEKAISKIEDGDLKEFKNLEVLKALEDRVPEQARPAILRAQENALKRLRGDIEELQPVQSERIEKMLEKSRGDESHYIEILNELKDNGDLPDGVIKELPLIKMRLEERKTEREQKMRDNSDEPEEMNETEDSHDDSSDDADDSMDR